MCLNDQRYFIAFIEDYSRYMYLFLLYDKNEALDDFKMYKVEVEKQTGKQIEIVRSDKGGEYYGRYIEKDNYWVYFRDFYRNIALLLNTQCQAHHHKMVWLKDENGP